MPTTNNFIGLRSYSDHTVGTIHLKRDENPETTLTFGVEVECEPKRGNGGTVTGGRENAMRLVHDIVGDNIYFKADGSLRGMDAVEVISEPCSLAYHMYQMRWKHVMKTLVKLGYRSHDSENCGFHIHVGREQLGRTDDERIEVIRKLKVYLALHWSDVLKFTRRRDHEIHWCQPERYGSWLFSDEVCTDEWVENVEYWVPYENDHGGRYRALNCDTRNPTIEFRIFKGTLKRDTFVASLQWVNELVKWAQRASWDDVRHSTFMTPFSHTEYEELRAYLVTRGLAPAEYLGTLRRAPDFRGTDGVAPAVA